MRGWSALGMPIPVSETVRMISFSADSALTALPGDPEADTTDPMFVAAAMSSGAVGTCPSGNAAVTGAQFVISSHPTTPPQLLHALTSRVIAPRG